MILRGLWKLTWIEIKIFLREPLGAFGTIGFPVLIFLAWGRAASRRLAPSSLAANSFIRVDLPVFASLLIAISSVLSLVTIISIYREGGILKRLRATPLRPQTILTAQVLVKLALTAATLALMVLAGKRYYPVGVHVRLFSFTIALLISTWSILSIGFLIASIVPTARFAQPVGAMILYPMIAVSGLFVPIESLPPVLHAVARVLPLTYAVPLLQGIWNGDAWLAHVGDVAALVVVFVVCAALSAKVFSLGVAILLYGCFKHESLYCPAGLRRLTYLDSLGTAPLGWFCMNPILVIGATGTVGRQVVSRLAATCTRVRAMARNPGAARLPPQVEVVRGDLTVPETLDGCFDGIDTVFLVWTAPPPAVAPALERITKQAQRIVFLSAPLKTAHPLFQQPNPLRAMFEQIERLIETSGLEWTFLRPGMFAANALNWWAPQIRVGDVVRWPYLAAPTAPIDERDIAAVAVRALCEDGHAGAEYVLTGPQSLSQFEQVSAIARVIGRSLRIEEMSPDEARRELLTIGPLVAVNMLLTAWAAAIGQPAHVTSTVEEITGAPAKTFLDWATDHAAEFRA